MIGIVFYSVLLRCDSNDLVIPMKFNGERTQIHNEKKSIDSAGIVLRNPENDVCSKPIRISNRFGLTTDCSLKMKYEQMNLTNNSNSNSDDHRKSRRNKQ